MLALRRALTSRTRHPRVNGMTLTEAHTLFETIMTWVFCLGLVFAPLLMGASASIVRARVERRLTPKAQHGKMRA